MRKYISRKMIDDIAEALDWKTYWYDDCVEFEKYSPAGEDYMFTVWYKSLIDIPDGVTEVYQTFDAEEHAKLWINSGASGVPDLRTLLDDADAIRDMLEELSDAMQGN